MDGLV
jgi:hypothetical protein